MKSTRALASLGLFAGRSADFERDGADLFAELHEPRGRPRPGWRVARSSQGWPALLSGWIDNRAELAAQFGNYRGSDAGIYALAVERWGDRADRHLVGCYAGLVCMPDGTVRLSRSPWGGKGLFYHNGPDALLVASIPRPLFAAGLAKRLRPDAVDRLLTMRLPDDSQALFQDVEQVPHGAVVRITTARATTDRWYDPLALAPARLRSDDEYAEAANDLLAQAASAALAIAKNPGITLSGGLDSPLTCAELLRQLPAGQRLPSFTFHPVPGWDGTILPHKFGDDRPYVEQFAAMHPALDPHFFANRETVFDDRAEQIFAASDAAYPARVLGSTYHDLYAAARNQGCDWLFTADAGNMTFSNSALWAPGEFLREGRWRQLWMLAAARVADPRPVWRRILAHAVMPQLPRGLRSSIRRLVHGNSSDANRWANPFLQAGSRLGQFRDADAIAGNIMTVDRDESRQAYVAANYHAMGLAPEITDGYEQVFGIRLRDVTAYRPLIEFSLSIPTDQFVRDGQTRWLARRMAAGKLPEAQRLNRLYGEHNADWHVRMTPRLEGLKQQVAALTDHPQLGEVLDVRALGAALEEWPQATPDDPILNERLRFYLPANLYVARFIDHVTGRNPS